MNLVADLALILVAAGVFTVISKVLKQPLILGYIVAGFIVGPHLGIFETTSADVVKQWSSIGIIFLMFALGLEFSFKKLLKVGNSAFITAITNCLGMFVVGIITGRLLSWNMMESIFLGGMLSMSSTTIIIKAYDEMGLKNKPYASLVFGALVIEDLIAVLLMVLLSTLAASNKFAGGELFFCIVKMLFFIILWFLVGIFFIPMILKKVHKYLSDEILLIISLGLCFGMVSLAELVGFSAALGAFVMGSILAETFEGERIIHLIGGIKNLFGAIFFVSVGMLVDPKVIGDYWGTIIVLTIVTMCGIMLFSSSGVILSGQGLDNAVHTGFSLAQLGEFSFIIAAMGCNLGVLRDFIYPVIISVSVLTTFTTPYMIKAADPAYKFLQNFLPASFIAKVNSSPNNNIHTVAAENEWKRLIKSYVTRVVLYGVILVAILLGSRLFLDGLVDKLCDDWSKTAKDLTCVLVTLAVMSPFVIGIAVTGSEIARSSDKLLKERDSNAWPVIALAMLRIFIGMGFVLFVILWHFDISFLMILLILVVGVLFFFLTRKYLGHLSLFEDVFIANLNEKEQRERELAPVATSVSDNLSKYDVHTEIFVISHESMLAGKTLREMPFRHNTRTNIVKIMRGKRNILIPSGDEELFPLDKLLAVGTSEQLNSLRDILSESDVAVQDEDVQFDVKAITLAGDSFLTGKTLREAGMKSYGCMVISMLRDGVFETNPKPDLKFQQGDVVWLAGEKSACDWWK